jgi:hypothetical protein
VLVHNGTGCHTLPWNYREVRQQVLARTGQLSGLASWKVDFPAGHLSVIPFRFSVAALAPTFTKRMTRASNPFLAAHNNGVLLRESCAAISDRLEFDREFLKSGVNPAI